MVAATTSATQLTNSADIFGGGTISSPDSLKTGTKTGSSEQGAGAESASAKMFGSFDPSKFPQGTPAAAIGAGVQGLNFAQAQPYFNGQPQNQGQGTATPPANTNAAATTNAAPGAAGTTINVGPEAGKDGISNKDIVERLRNQGWEGKDVKELPKSMVKQLRSGDLSFSDAYQELSPAKQ